MAMAPRRALAAMMLAFSAKRVTADYDMTVSNGILTSLNLELMLPWMTVDFDSEVIASGAAIKDNSTVVDADTLKQALFAGIKAAGDAVRASPAACKFRLKPDNTEPVPRLGWGVSTGVHALRGNRSSRTVLWLL